MPPESTQTTGSGRPPAAPKLARRVAEPIRNAGRVLLVLGLPLAASMGYLGKDAALRTLHTGVLFVVLLALFRLMGKRELNRLSSFELVTLMLIPEVLSNTLQGEGPLLTGLVGLSTLLFMVLSTSLLSHRFALFEHAVEAKPTLLVMHGQLLQDALNRERIAPDELFGEMHKQGLSELGEIKWALLESSGEITFVPEPGHHAASQGKAGSGRA